MAHPYFSFFAWRGRYTKAGNYARTHKVTSGIVAVALLSFGYFAYRAARPADAATRYVLGTAATSTIVASISESGQVSASDSIDIKPQVGGTIDWIGVKAGDKVQAGQALMRVDDTDAQQTLADSKKGLASDKLQYQKDTAQAPITYQNDLNARTTAQDNLASDYNDVYSHLTNTFLDLPTVVSGAQDTLYGYDFGTNSQWNVDVLYSLFTSYDTGNVEVFMDTAKRDYADARKKYDAAVDIYKRTPRTADTKEVDALLAQSVDMMTAVAQALQSELNFFGTASDLAETLALRLPANFATVQDNARSYLSTANTDLATLLADKKTVDDAKKAIVDATNAIALDKVGNPDGTNPISLQISKNAIEKSEQDIKNQEADLAKYAIRAPFAGTIATVDVKLGDAAGSGAVATIISPSRVATLSVNEVDAAKIKLGDVATLTFDAIEGLSLTGTVAEIDPVGVVSQGVVSYDVKVAFDTQDARVKPGMTVNAEIRTDVRRDTLAVPSSAVHARGARHYVQAFDPPLPSAGGAGVPSDRAPGEIPVEIGISDDVRTEILSGLHAGQQVVARVTGGAANTTSPSTPTGRGFGGPVLRGL